jgi:hypothetical protein
MLTNFIIQFDIETVLAAAPVIEAVKPVEEVAGN